MANEFKSIFKQLSIYGVFNILSKSVGFLMLPLYTRYLEPAHYGMLELVEMTAAIFEIFASAGIGFAVFKFYHRYETKEEQGRVVSSAITASLILHSFFALGGILFSRPLSVLVFEAPDYQGYFTLILFRIIVSGPISIGIDYLRVLNRAQLFGWLSLLRLVLGVSLNIIFLVTMGMGMQGVLLSGIISQLMVGIPLTIYLYRRLGFHLDFSKLVPMFKYGTPFIVVLIGQLVVNFADRFILQRYSTLTEVGIYSLGYKFGFMVNFLVVTPFLLMWEGKLFEIEKQANARALYARLLTYYVFLLVWVALTITLFIQEIVSVMTTPAYYAATHLVPMIALAYLFNGLQVFFRLGMLIKSKTSIIGTVTFIQSVVALILYWAAIRLWNAWGAALATALSFAGIFIANYFFSQRLYFIPLERTRLLRIGLVALIVLSIKGLLPNTSFLQVLFLKGGLALVFPVLLAAIGFLNEQEKATIKEVSMRLRQQLSLSSYTARVR
jgi:O-antigen/teichoic acid export membrane protein